MDPVSLQGHMAKTAVVADENCPAIPRKMYQLSEVRQSSLKPSSGRAQQFDKVVSAGSEDYHIPPDRAYIIRYL